MLLNRVLVTGYKSIKAMCNLIIDNQVTVLIGANDHGKSNLLTAILALNDDPKYLLKQSDLHWDLGADISPRIEWHFSFDKKELKELALELAYTPSPKEIDTQEAKANTFPPEEIQQQPIAPEFYPESPDKELVFFREGYDQPVRVASTPFKTLKEKEASWLARRPIVELFQQADLTFLDSVTREDLDKDSYSAMKGIFIVAGIWEQIEKIFIQNPVTEKLLAKASEKLTEELRNKWAQGEKHTWYLRHDNGKITLRIEDNVVSNTYVLPSQRSSGFKSYFYLCMSIIAKNHGLPPDKKHIYLFDEPGNYLHPKAQIDLQRSFEKISDDSQIIYTTHSLFLISKNHPIRNRVVLKTLNGTLIDHKAFAENWKSVRNTLGILMSNNLLIANKSILVEGRSDVVYILNAIRQMKEDKQIDIDVNDFTIIDCGNSSNYSAMAKLMFNDGRTVYCLIDNDKGGQAIKARVDKAFKEYEGKEQTVTTNLLPQPNTSTEDIFLDCSVLKRAIKKIVEDLIKSGERTIKKEYMGDNKELNEAFELELQKIKRQKDQTLGTTIKTIGSNWFEDDDELSKVSIAIQYVSLCEAGEEVKPANQTDEAVNVIKAIKDNLKLRGEKEFESGVMETISE